MAADLKTALLIALQTTGEERVAKLRQSLVDLGISADKAEDLAAGLDTELRQIADSSGAAEKKSIDLAGALKTVAGAAIVREFFQVNASFEAMQKSLELVTGDTVKAAQEMAFVRSEANRLGIEVGSAASSYVNLAASAKGTNLEGAATREIWSSVVGTMAALGKSSADVEGAITQLGQGISKGRFELEDLKSIAERIPGFFKLFADQLGVTTEELFDMISAGELTSDKLPQLADALKKLAGEGGVDTANASLARLKNTWTDVQLSLGETGGLAAMTTFLKGATVAVAGLWEGVEILGKTFGNLAYSITSMDFAGYRTRQKEILAEAKADLDKVIASTFGVKDGLDKAGDAGEQAGAQIAQSAQVAQVNYKALTEEIKAAAAALKSETELASVQTRLSIEQQKTAFELAKAKGDVAGQTKAKNEITRLEIELSQLQARAAVAEAEASLELAQAKYQEALAKKENVRAAEAELTAAGYNYAAKQVQSQITEELANRTKTLATVTDQLKSSTGGASGAIGDMGGSMQSTGSATQDLTRDIEALTAAEERLAAVRDQKNASRNDTSAVNWAYALGEKGIKLTPEEMAQFKAVITDTYEQIRGTYSGQVVYSYQQLLDQAIKEAVEFARQKATGGGGTSTTQSSTAPTRSATSGGSSGAGGSGVTININGPILGGNKEQLARDLMPVFDKINRLRS